MPAIFSSSIMIFLSRRLSMAHTKTGLSALRTPGTYPHELNAHNDGITAATYIASNAAIIIISITYHILSFSSFGNRRVSISNRRIIITNTIKPPIMQKMVFNSVFSIVSMPLPIPLNNPSHTATITSRIKVMSSRKVMRIASSYRYAEPSAKNGYYRFAMVY